MRKEFFLFVILSVLLVVSCKKEEDLSLTKQQEEKIECKDGRLVFSSTSKFGSTFKTLKEGYKEVSNYNALLENVIGKSNFYSLSRRNYLKSATVDSLNTEFEEGDTLVSDPIFNSLLNADKEIEVEGTVFKITPYGTFAFQPDKKVKVEAIIELLEAGQKIDEQKLSDYFYQVDSGITRYDTYKEIQDNTVEILAYVSDSTNINHVKSAVVEDIENHYIVKKHTIVGSFLQNTFGFSKTVTREFSSKRRIKVSFSCPNYLVLTYVSAEITYQKKNWIGWSKTECEKLVFGWDGMVITLNGGPAFNGQKTPTVIGKIQPPLVNNTFFALYLPEVSLYYNDTWNFKLPNSVTLTDKDLHKAFKAGFDWLKRNYSAPSNEIIVFPNPNKMIIGPYEKVRSNAGYMENTFDWAIGGSFKWNMDGSVELGNFSPSPLSFTVGQACIYGKAYGDGRWLGVRITKDWE